MVLLLCFIALELCELINNPVKRDLAKKIVNFAFIAYQAFWPYLGG